MVRDHSRKGRPLARALMMAFSWNSFWEDIKPVIYPYTSPGPLQHYRAPLVGVFDVNEKKYNSFYTIFVRHIQYTKERVKAYLEVL